jgi:hypothetical protein
LLAVAKGKVPFFPVGRGVQPGAACPPGPPRRACSAADTHEAGKPLANASGRTSSQSSKDAGLERRERTNLPVSWGDADGEKRKKRIQFPAIVIRLPRLGFQPNLFGIWFCLPPQRRPRGRRNGPLVLSEPGILVQNPRLSCRVSSQAARRPKGQPTLRGGVLCSLSFAADKANDIVSGAKHQLLCLGER